MEVPVYAGMCVQEVEYSNGCVLLMISVSIVIAANGDPRESWVRLPDREYEEESCSFCKTLCEVFCTTVSRVQEKSYHRLF